jgi:hypothetical protein
MLRKGWLLCKTARNPMKATRMMREPLVMVKREIRRKL